MCEKGLTRPGRIGKIPRLNTPKNHQLIENATINPLLGKTLGKFINPVFANSTRAEGLLSGSPEEGVDARGIQPFYTGILARMTDMDLKIGIDNDVFTFTATPRAKLMGDEPEKAEAKAA